MKKVLCVAMAALMAVSLSYAVEHEQENDEDVVIGVGFQGVVLDQLLSGVAVRGKPAPIGWQVELVQGSVDADFVGNVDLLILKGKGYWPLVEKANSTFYTGASLGYWAADLTDGTGFLGDAEIDGWSFAPLIGAEWNFAELPELGFNFEVSYEFDMLDVDPGGLDLNIYGITVSTGVIYYF